MADSRLRDPYEEAIIRRLDAILPNAYARLEAIDVFPEAPAELVLSELLGSACQATHIGSINAGRRAVGRMPVPWLARNMGRIAEKALNLDDEWEYRRLLELMLQVAPSLLPEFIERGMKSENEEVREAAEDMELAKRQGGQGRSA